MSALDYIATDLRDGETLREYRRRVDAETTTGGWLRAVRGVRLSRLSYSAAALIAAAAVGGPLHPAPTPHLDVRAPAAHAASFGLDDAERAPSYVRVIAPGDDVHVGGMCGGKLPSDRHVYSAHGRGFRQKRDRLGQTSWHASTGRAVAGYDPVNRDVYSFARRQPVIFAAWCES